MVRWTCGSGTTISGRAPKQFREYGFDFYIDQAGNSGSCLDVVGCVEVKRRPVAAVPPQRTLEQPESHLVLTGRAAVRLQIEEAIDRDGPFQSEAASSGCQSARRGG